MNLSFTALSLAIFAAASTEALAPDGGRFGGFHGRGEMGGPTSQRYGDMSLQNDFYGVPSFGAQGGYGGGGGGMGMQGMPSFQGGGGGFEGGMQGMGMQGMQGGMGMQGMQGMPSFGGPGGPGMQGMHSFQGGNMGMPGMGGMGMPSFGMNEFHRPRGGQYGRERGSMPISAMGGARGIIPDEDQGRHLKNDIPRESQSYARQSMMRNEQQQRMGRMGGMGNDFRGDMGGPMMDERMNRGNMGDQRMNGNMGGRRSMGRNQRSVRPNGDRQF